MSSSRVSLPKEKPIYSFQYSKKQTNYYTSINLKIDYQSYTNNNDNHEWVSITVGDTVAIQGDDTNLERNNEWWAGQIISICTEDDEIKIMCRWYNRKADIATPIEEYEKLEVEDMHILYETSNIDEIEPESILGPIRILTLSEYIEHLDTNIKKDNIPHFWCEKFYNTRKLGFDEDVQDFSADGRFKRGIELCTNKEYKQIMLEQYEKQNNETAFKKRKRNDDVPTRKRNDEDTHRGLQVNQESTDISINKSLQEDTIEEITTEPFYKNKSTNQTFFKSISFPSWKIKLGDTVALHSELSKYSNHPFSVPWYPAEIITMWSNGKHDKESIQLEFRWIYRREDLPIRVQLALGEDREVIAEVFETDHVDVCHASSILGPVHLFANMEDYNQNKTGDLNYLCYRKIWSAVRGAFMPTGDLTSRIERGRMHSNELKRDPSLRLALKQNDAIKIHSIKSINDSEWIQRYSNAISKLTLSSASYDASYALPCREEKIEHIKSYLKMHLCKEASSSTQNEDLAIPNLFIAGPPGIGKTASVLHVIHQLQLESSQGSIPPFYFININGMTMSHPLDVYILFWEAISSQKLNHINAHAKLEKFFSPNNQGGNKIIVLLLDEVDYLITPKQEVLYNLFHWSVETLNSQGNKLIVIGISNTINLPELLTRRVQSRLGTNACRFKAYNGEEIEKILQRRLLDGQDDTSFSVFDRTAISFASKKVGGMNGDLRNAFQLCRSAAESVLAQLQAGERSDNVLVGTRDIQAASLESLQSPFEFIVTHAASYEVLVIVCMASLMKVSGRVDGWFSMQEILTKTGSVSGAMGDPEYLPALSLDELSGILSRLNECGLFDFQTSKKQTIALSAAGCCLGKWPRTLVQMNMQDFEVMKALKDTMHKRLAQKYLGNF